MTRQGTNVYAALEQFDNILRPRINDFITTMLPNIGLFAAVIMLVFVGYKVVKSFLGENEKLDTSTLVRPCLTLAALVLYSDLVDLLIETPITLVNDIVVDAIGIDPTNLNALKDQLTHTQDSGGSDGGGIFDIIQLHDFLEFFHLAIFFIGSIAGGYILFRQLIVKTIYLILGPFALAFSLIVGNERVLNNWFQGYVSVLLWLPVFSIMQGIMLEIPVTTTNFEPEDIIFSLVVQVVMIFSILKVPQFANILVAQGASMGQQYGEGMKQRAESIVNNRSMQKSMKGGK